MMDAGAGECLSTMSSLATIAIEIPFNEKRSAQLIATATAAGLSESSSGVDGGGSGGDYMTSKALQKRSSQSLHIPSTSGSLSFHGTNAKLQLQRLRGQMLQPPYKLLSQDSGIEVLDRSLMMASNNDCCDDERQRRRRHHHHDRTSSTRSRSSSSVESLGDVTTANNSRGDSNGNASSSNGGCSSGFSSGKLYERNGDEEDVDVDVDDDDDDGGGRGGGGDDDGGGRFRYRKLVSAPTQDTTTTTEDIVEKVPLTVDINDDDNDVDDDDDNNVDNDVDVTCLLSLRPHNLHSPERR